jgi:hypothetical protein
MLHCGNSPGMLPITAFAVATSEHEPIQFTSNPATVPLPGAHSSHRIPHVRRERGAGSPQKTWLDHGGAEGGQMELNGWTSPQMLADTPAPAAPGSAAATTAS